MQRILLCSLVIFSLLYQKAFCVPTINTEDSKPKKYEKQYFAGDGSDIIHCPVDRDSRNSVQASSFGLFFERNNTSILGTQIPGYIDDFSTTVSFKNLNIKKQENDVTILCKGFFQLTDPETFVNITYVSEFVRILCFQENCDKENFFHEESTDVLLPLLMVAIGVTLSLCIAKFLVVFQRNRELHTDPLNEFMPSESIPHRQILLSDIKPGCSVEASST